MWTILLIRLKKGGLMRGAGRWNCLWSDVEILWRWTILITRLSHWGALGEG